MADFRPVCRIGDHGEGICYLHDTPTPFTTTFYTGSERVFADGIRVCVVGTLGHASCGHTTIATNGSEISVSPDGALHRVGDTGRILEDESGRSTYVATTGSLFVDSL